MIRFGATGCGRSGTGWVAEMLTAAGIPCRHESAVTGWDARYRVAVGGGDEDHGESTWLLAAALDDLPEDLPVIHVVRSPLDHIRAEMGRGALMQQPPAPWVNLLHTRTDLLDELNPVDRCAAYWLRWNRMITEYEYPVWVLGSIGAKQVNALGRAVGTRLPARAASKALKLSPVGQGERDESVGWGDIRPDLADQIAELADRLGVAIETEETDDGTTDGGGPGGEDGDAGGRGGGSGLGPDRGRGEQDSGVSGDGVDPDDGDDDDPPGADEAGDPEAAGDGDHDLGGGDA